MTPSIALSPPVPRPAAAPRAPAPSGDGFGAAFEDAGRDAGRAAAAPGKTLPPASPDAAPEPAPPAEQPEASPDHAATPRAVVSLRGTADKRPVLIARTGEAPLLPDSEAGADAPPDPDAATDPQQPAAAIVPPVPLPPMSITVPPPVAAGIPQQPPMARIAVGSGAPFPAANAGVGSSPGMAAPLPPAQTPTPPAASQTAPQATPEPLVSITPAAAQVATQVAAVSGAPSPFDTATLLTRRGPGTVRGAKLIVGDEAAAPAALLAGSLTTGAALAPGAAAPAPPIDLTRPTWPTAMIDRIEHLRDTAEAVSARIRVVPDALGAIDVSVRTDGQVTHVHLAAEQAQTRAMLAEASPRLAEIAEQRGLKLGRADIDPGGGTGGGDRQQPPAEHRPPPRPAARVPRAQTHPDDHRVA